VDKLGVLYFYDKRILLKEPEAEAEANEMRLGWQWGSPGTRTRGRVNPSFWRSGRVPEEVKKVAIGQIQYAITR
jgi:hypothetical protein